MQRYIQILLLTALPLVTLAGHSLLDYGAKAGVSDTEIAFLNSEALNKAVLAANSSDSDRVVLFPVGNVFYMMPSFFENLFDITFQVEGEVRLSEDHENWPNDGQSCNDFWHIVDSKNITLRGNGVINGQGYWWWMREYVRQNKFSRPHILKMQRVEHAYITQIKWENAPQYHIYATDINDFLFENFVIEVDIFEQKKLSIKYGHFDFNIGLPTFPLNTDGIDPAGSNIIIRNVTITNFDDAVAIKPGYGEYKVAQCAENILVENCLVVNGVGMTIGTVPPHEDVTCVRNVVFRNITFIYPFKAVYIKTNPGHEGTGIIENILYENLTIKNPIWWAIYIGPQQQKQPDGGGPGCMVYPILKDCKTEPRITIRNITLRNIHSQGGVLPPGIIRCNETNPCTDFTFDNVIMDGWFVKSNLGYITENVIGKVINSFPAPKFDGKPVDQAEIDKMLKAVPNFRNNGEIIQKE